MTYTDPTTCPDCPWERFTGDQTADERDLAKHRHNRHGEALPEQWATGTKPARKANMDWRTQAIDALIVLARSRAVFAIYEISEFGCPEPPDPAHDWGKFTADARQLELIRKVGATESKRPETKGSLVKTWTAGPAVIAGLKPSSERTA